MLNHAFHWVFVVFVSAFITAWVMPKPVAVQTTKETVSSYVPYSPTVEKPAVEVKGDVKGNNAGVSVNGNGNHVGDNHFHYHRTETVIVRQVQTVVVREVQETVKPYVPQAKVQVVRTECDDKNDLHLQTVAAWKKQFGK